MIKEEMRRIAKDKTEEDKRLLSEEIDRQTREFFNKGGEIEKLSEGATGCDNLPLKMMRPKKI